MNIAKTSWLAAAAAFGLLQGIAPAQTMPPKLPPIARPVTPPPIPMKLPEIAKPGEHGYVSSEFIYALDAKPTKSCHASTIVETDKGLVAAWFGGTAERNPDVTIWVSRKDKGAEAWTKPIEAGDGIQPTGPRLPCWNPVLFQPENAPLMLFFKVGPAPSQWWGMMTTSEDGGKTWAKPHRMGEDPAVGHLIGPVKNKPIQFSDGMILCPSSTEDKGWRVHFEWTTDLGKSWHVIGPINGTTDFSAIQPSILTYPGGKLQILCRSKDGLVMQAWSQNAGKTWTALMPTPLPNPSSGTDAVTLKDGRQLLVYNHTNVIKNPTTDLEKAMNKGRYMLNVAISKDGEGWAPIMTLEKDQGGNSGYAYPAVIQTEDGMIHITYTWRRETIKHVILDPAKLAGPRP